MGKNNDPTMNWCVKPKGWAAALEFDCGEGQWPVACAKVWAQRVTQWKLELWGSKWVYEWQLWGTLKEKH